MRKLLLALAVLVILAAAIIVYAQQDPPIPRPRPMPPMQPVMVTEGAYLYVLRGNALTKLKTGDLEVVAQKMIPMPKPPQPPPRGE